jgi:hypothetical protein
MFEPKTQEVEWYGAFRLGFRYRLGANASIGTGLGGGVYRGERTVEEYCDDDYYDCNTDIYQNVSGNLHLDFEWSIGKRWPYLALSFAQRLVWDALALAQIHVPSEFTLAVYPTGGSWALTFSLFFTWTSPAYVWGGGTAGLTISL